MREFEYVGWTKDGKFKDDMQEMICNQVIELLELFGTHGHSGSSAPYAINLFKTLAKFDPIGGIQCTDDEFSNDIDKDTWQNKRLSSVFRDDKGCYYLNAIVWQEQNGSTFTGRVEGIKSAQYIKKLPFIPKTFYVDVVSTEWADKEETEKKEGGGWWTSKIKDRKQLDAVFEYYTRKD